MPEIHWSGVSKTKDGHRGDFFRPDLGRELAEAKYTNYVL